MSLVPATMFLMGRATWWMPKWLDKILPTVDIEGTELEKEWEASHAKSRSVADRMRRGRIPRREEPRKNARKNGQQSARKIRRRK